MKPILKNSLELELDFLIQQKYTNSKLIGEIQTYTLDSKKGLIIFFSFIIGLFFSIFIVFIKEFVKTIKKGYA